MEELEKGWYKEQKTRQMEKAEWLLQMWDSLFKMIMQAEMFFYFLPWVHKDPFRCD